MGKAWDWMKEHPYVTAGIVFAVGVLVVLMFLPKSQAAAPPDNVSAALAAGQAAAIESGNQLQGMQLQAQTAAQAIDAGVKTDAADGANAVALAQISSAANTSAATISAGMAKDTNATQLAIAGVAAGAAVQQSSIAAQANYYTTSAAVTQNMYDTLAASNVATTNSAFDFLSGLTARNMATATAPMQSTSGNVAFTHDATGNINSLSFGIENNEFPATGPTQSEQIAALYQGYLGRAPDTAGLNYYLADLTSGHETLAGIATAIQASPEYALHTGTVH